MSKNKNKRNDSNELKQCTLYVKGMHCASCEVLIEKTLLKENGIKSVDASLKDRKVIINYVGPANLDVGRLSQNLKKYGYKFSHKEFRIKNIPALSIKNGSLIINPKKLQEAFKVFAVVVCLLFGFYLFENLQIGQHVSVDSTSSLPAFLLLGIIAGLSSCAALIGGLLLSMTKQWNELYIDESSTAKKAEPHVMFHMGRIISFAVFGGLLGLIGETVSLNNTVFLPILTIVVSILMFLLALQMLGVGWAQKFRLTAPKQLTRFVADEKNFQGRYMPFGIGTLTFILPCGFTLIAQTIALTSGSFLQGALIMFFFALGTLPTLLAISYSGLALNSKPNLTAKFNLVAGLIIIFFVIYNINGQLNVLGLPSLSDISLTNSTTEIANAVETNVDGNQILNITASGFEYLPNGSTTLSAGIPAKLIVDNQGVQGCAAYMAASGLIENFVALKSGQNIIDLGTPQKGTYKLTCSMGMVRPVIINVI